MVMESVGMTFTTRSLLSKIAFKASMGNDRTGAKYTQHFMGGTQENIFLYTVLQQYNE